MATDSLTLLRRLLARGRLRHMQALVMLDDLRSMSRAADAMNMTQPGMTQLVAELEQLLDAKLFLRHARGVEPTSTARALLPVARRIIGASEEGAEVIASHNRRDGGLVRIACTVAAQGGMIQQVVPRFAEAYPDIQLQVEPVVGQSLDASFGNDEFDLVCCRRREVVPDEWVWVYCREDALSVMCGASHPLARTGRASMAQLANERWLLNHVATIARHHFDEMRRMAGWTKIRELQVISRIPALVWIMLDAGDAVSLLPDSVVELWTSKGQMVRLDTPMTLPLAPLGFYWRPDHAGRATRLLAEAFMKQSQDLPDQPGDNRHVRPNF